MLDAKKVPKQMKALPNWVLWKLEKRKNSKGELEEVKVPFNAKTLGYAMSNNKGTWSDFITAYSVLINEPSFIGLGFMLSDDIVCIDLDNKDDSLSEKEFNDILDDCLNVIPSYCEKSVSGKGYHIFAKGIVPEGYRKKKNVEMYDTARFIAFTGDIIEGSQVDVIEAQSGIDYIHGKYLGSKIKNDSKNLPISEVFNKNEYTTSLTIQDVLKRAINNDKFMTLYAGDWESLGFPSQSEADASFSSMLAFYCEKDLKLMDDIFRMSGLYRDKYERKQAGSTYGEITLQSAIQWVQDVYGSDMVEAELVQYKIEDSKSSKQKVVNAEFVDHKKKQSLSNPITESRFTDTANSQSLIVKYGDSIRYNFDNKVWFVWNGKYWEWDIKGKVKRFAEEVANEMLEQSKKVLDTDGIKNALRMLNSAGKNNMINEAQHQDGIAIVNADCDNQKFLLNTHSGVYDLKNDKLLPHTKEPYITKIADVEIDDSDEPKLWLKFLDDIFMGDEEIINFIQKAVGYTLSGSIKEQVIFILFGGGNNGKSVFIDTIQTMLGDYATTVPIEVLMERKGRGNVETTLARIKGARMIHASENDEDDQINEGLIKQITGGEQVIGRFLYGNEFEYYPEYKLWLSTNNKPQVKGTDFGIWRRIIIIPFKLTIARDKVDRNLTDKLKNEMPKILNWAIEGFRKYEKEGLELPQSLIDEKDIYKKEMDYISNFISDRIESKDEYKLPATTVYKEYEKWCRMTNSKVMSSIAFGKEFGKYFSKKRESTGYVYMNCTIKSDNVEYSIKEFRGKK